ncbi:HAAS signaling domain-containing protein [Solibacillus ferritrahens]|uniref:HAAS signaling domain-containing protein n=1 Tax=Solibacillus ferritrahens TaxID=3098620 RepID=UPI003008A95F
MMRENSVNEYLETLKENLTGVPQEEIKLILHEIEDHLNGEIQNEIDKGKDRQEAEKYVISRFKKPQQLAEEYLQTYEESNPKSVTFLSVTSMWFIGAVYLMNPILKGFIEPAFFTLGLAVLIFASIYLMLKKNWRKLEIKTIKLIPPTIAFLIFPLSIVSFWINGNINSFLLSYTVIYWVFLIISSLYFFKIIKKNNLGKVSFSFF